MTNKQDKPTQEALRDLLKKNSDPHAVSDDFEREALQGFALYNSEEDALKSKDQLDERIYSEVFSKKEKPSRALYWAAAAALILVVGFTVYMFQTHPVHEVKDLVISTPPAPPVISEETSPIQPSESYTPVERVTPPSEKRSPAVSEKKDSEFSQVNDMATESDSKNTGSVAEESMASVTPRASEDIKTIRSTTSEQSVEQRPAPLNTKVRDQETVTNSAPVMSGATAPPAAPGEVAIASEKSTRKKKAESFSGKGSGSNCTYSGGEKALQKDVTRLLKEKNILSKFDATLYINNFGKVEKVVLKRSFALTAREQTQVIEALKTLGDFVFKTIPENTVMSEYLLEFRP